jgi:hypothetical protein
MEAISNYNGPKLIVTKKRKKDASDNADPAAEHESDDHYNADLDLDSTESTEVSVKTVESESKTAERVNLIAKNPIRSALLLTLLFGILMVKLDNWVGKKICSLSWVQLIVIEVCILVAVGNIFTVERVDRFQ